VTWKHLSNHRFKKKKKKKKITRFECVTIPLINRHEPYCKIVTTEELIKRCFFYSSRSHNRIKFRRINLFASWHWPARFVNEFLEPSFHFIISQESHVTRVSYSEAVPISEQRGPWLKKQESKHRPFCSRSITNLRAMKNKKLILNYKFSIVIWLKR
jgi:hypothetical protein